MHNINFRAFAAPLAGLAAALSLATGAASADPRVLVETGDPTQVNGGYSLLPPGYFEGFGGQSIAARFTVTGENVVLTDIEGYVVRFQQGQGTYHIALYEDGPGPNPWIPGAELYSTALSTTGNNARGYIGASGLDWAIGAGSYWVGFEVRAGDTMNGFMPYFVPRPLREALGPAPTYYPAPGAPGSAFRISGTVPEPGTWALMILGFGSAGVMLRRRRVALT